MNKQSGFSAVEGLLIVFVVGLISFGGWYTWNQNEEEAGNNNSSSENQQVDSNIKKWTDYEGSDGFSFSYPENWKIVSENESTSITISPDGIAGIPNIFAWKTSADNSDCDQTSNEVTEIMVGSMSAKQFRGGTQTDQITTCVIDGESTFHIVYSFHYETDPDVETYEAIVGTFKIKE